MHEFSLAQSLMQQLEELARQYNAETIHTVRVEIGKHSGIVAESFSFGFEVLAKKKSLTDKAVLEISESEGNDLLLNQVEME